jgi:hypothetical protein
MDKNHGLVFATSGEHTNISPQSRTRRASLRCWIRADGEDDFRFAKASGSRTMSIGLARPGSTRGNLVRQAPLRAISALS